MYNFELLQREFLTPFKSNIQFFHPPSSRSSKYFDPPHLSTNPYCWIKNDQPLSYFDDVI